MELTLEDANTKCEEAIRQNLENIERSDEDVFLRVMEATRKQAGMVMGYLNYPNIHLASFRDPITFPESRRS